MNSYILRPRSVTLQPICIPSRRRNAEIALRAMVIIGFCPVIRLIASAAVSRCFFSCVAAPTPMLTTIFSNRGNDSLFLRPNFSASVGITCWKYRSWRRGVGAGTAGSSASALPFLPLSPLAGFSPLGGFSPLCAPSPFSAFGGLAAFSPSGLAAFGGFSGFSSFGSLAMDLSPRFLYGRHKCLPHDVISLLLFLFGRRDRPQGSTALLAVTLFAAILREARASADAFAALTAEQQNIADLQRHLFREAAALRILLAAADVLIDTINAFDDEAADAAIDRQHLCALAFVVAGDHFDSVVGFDVHDFRLSTVTRLRWPG